MFFLSGGQIDGHANINLNCLTSENKINKRWSGALNPLFFIWLSLRLSYLIGHSSNTLVKNVDFVTATGSSDTLAFRRGGADYLITDLVSCKFDRVKDIQTTTIHLEIAWKIKVKTSSNLTIQQKLILHLNLIKSGKKLYEKRLYRNL